MYGKNYDELTLKTGKKQAYDKIHSQSRWGEKKGKFKVKIQSSPYSATDQAKILKEFPNAKFTKTNTYGFPPEHELYDKVWGFVDRGFKKSYKKLPLYAQKQLEDAFPWVKFFE